MSGFSPAVRRLVFNRAGGCCEVCGREITDGVPRSLHHRRPRGMGGSKRPETNGAANALLVDGDGVAGCHGWIESHRTEALELGLLVPQGRIPADVPVTLLAGVVLLDDYGNYVPTEGQAA